MIGRNYYSAMRLRKRTKEREIKCSHKSVEIEGEDEVDFLLSLHVFYIKMGICIAIYVLFG